MPLCTELHRVLPNCAVHDQERRRCAPPLARRQRRALPWAARPSHAGPHPPTPLIETAHPVRRLALHGAVFRRSIVPLPATMSRPPFGRHMRSASPSLDTAVQSQGIGACREDGRKLNSGRRPGAETGIRTLHKPDCAATAWRAVDGGLDALRQQVLQVIGSWGKGLRPGSGGHAPVVAHCVALADHPCGGGDG